MLEMGLRVVGCFKTARHVACRLVPFRFLRQKDKKDITTLIGQPVTKYESP